MDLVPQLAADHIRQVRAEWEALEAKELQVPAEVDTLVKDQALLATVRRLLTHFIESLIFVPPGGDPKTVDEKKDRASSSSSAAAVAAAAEKSDDETNIERGSYEPASSSEGMTTMMMRSTPTTGRSLSRSFSRMFQVLMGLFVCCLVQISNTLFSSAVTCVSQSTYFLRDFAL